MANPSDGTSGWRMILACMLANNFTLGLAYGSFGALLASNEQAFGVARDTISFGMSAVSTTMGVSALVMGSLVRRLTPRLSIAIGVATVACAFAGLALTTNFAFALAMWALLGFGIALAALLGPVALAAEFFPGRTGKMLAMTNMPIVLFVGPWTVTAVLQALGREGTYLTLAALLLPVLILVLRFLPRVAIVVEDQPKVPADVSAGSILKRPDFWLVSLGISVIACTGTAYVVHAIPFARAEGLEVSTSALMMSVYSGAGLVGVPLFGWLADKIGAPRTLAITGCIQSLCWAGLALSPATAFLFLSAALGAATTPLTTLHGAAMAQLFGVDGVGRSMGYSFAIKLPFLFVASPAVGYAFVQMGVYRPAFLIVALTLIVSVALLMVGSVARGLAPARAVTN